MASSGQYIASAVSISGYSNNYMFVNWQIASQNVSGNYTTINWQAYFHFNGCDAELDNGYVNTNVGTVWSNGGRVYNYSGNFTTRDQAISSGSFTVGADANGNSQLQFGLQMVVYASGTSSGTSGVWNLDRIPQAPGLLGMTVDSITTNSARLGAEITSYGHGTSATLEMFYKLRTSGSYISLGVQADAAGYNYWTVTGLLPATLYDYICNVTNNNGDFAQFTAQSFTTLVNNTMVVMDPF